MPHFGLSIPGTAPDRTPRTSIELAQRAEQAGAHSIWATERILDSTPDPFVTLGAVAAGTSHIKLGTSVALGVLRPPVLLAKAATAVDSISGGRLILGLGVGSRAEDFAAVEVSLHERGRRMDEALQICEMAWRGDPIAFSGKHHRIDVPAMQERTVQQPHPPIWFGGRAEAVLRRVSRFGQGFIASTSSGVEGFRDQWSTIRAHCERVGRDSASLTPAALAYVSVAQDPARAREVMIDHLVRSFGPERVARGLGLTGTPREVIRGAREYFDAGVEVLILSPVSAEERHLEVLWAEVLPALSEAH
jgi:probable F420-dependent oxidoreductase